MRRRSRGFTMTELMVTLSVTAILTTVALPSFRDYIANQRVRSAAQDLFSSLLYARSEAIKRNETVLIVPDAGGWSQGWSVVAGDGSVVSERGARTNVVIAATDLPEPFGYQRSGRLQPGAALPSFALCDAAGNPEVGRRLITIDLSGQPALRLAGSCGDG